MALSDGSRLFLCVEIIGVIEIISGEIRYALRYVVWMKGKLLCFNARQLY